MKRKLILLPITLTALIPMVSMVGCNDKKSEIHKVKIDDSSDTGDISIGTPEIVLSQPLTIPYEVIDPTKKELDVDDSWIKVDSTTYPLNEFSYQDNKVVITAEKVINYDITICLKSKDILAPDKTINVNETSSGWYIYSDSFSVENNDLCKFTFDLSKFTEEVWEADEIYWGFVFYDVCPDVSVESITINGTPLTYSDEFVEEEWYYSVEEAEYYWAIDFYNTLVSPDMVLEIYLTFNEKWDDLMVRLGSD